MRTILGVLVLLCSTSLAYAQPTDPPAGTDPVDSADTADTADTSETGSTGTTTTTAQPPASANQPSTVLSGDSGARVASSGGDENALTRDEFPFTKGEPQYSGAYRRFAREVFEKAHKPFEFHGFFRSGVGVGQNGGNQEGFQAPGAGLPGREAKFRLGNEFEGKLDATFLYNQEFESGLYVRGQVTAGFDGINGVNFGNVTAAFREAFAEVGGVIDSQPQLSFWAGQRYYRRHDIHIMDFFYNDNSGFGGGFEDLDLGFGKLHVALLGSADTATVTDNGVLEELNVDIRISDLQIATSALTFILDFAMQPGGDDMAATDIGGFGGAASLFLVTPLLEGFNKASIQVGFGPGADFGGFTAPVTDDTDGVLRLQLADQAVFRLTPDLDLAAVLLFQFSDADDAGLAGTPDAQFDGIWTSVGVRPVYHLTNHLSLASELGIDWVEPDGPVDGSVLAKLTVAPQIQAGRSFWGRPVLRAFVTAAFWGDDFEGVVGGPSVFDDQFGMSFGVQAESWW